MASQTQIELDNVTAKDSFLKNTDLMAMTLSHLQANVEYNKRWECLLNAALTCKDFLDVALDALWEKMDSIVPLLKLLPALHFEKGKYVLSGNVSQADWDRLQYYSRKVKFFEVLNDNDQHHCHQVHPLTYFRIAQLQSSALFPSLRHLHYNLSNTFLPDSHIFFFQSPLLDSLEFINTNAFEDTVIGSFLATLSSPTLSRIVLRNGEMSMDIFNNSISHFKQLRSLELLDAIFMSNFALLEVLGTLPRLANLTLKVIDPPEDSSSQNEGQRYFVALESLSVTGSFFLIQHILGFIDSPWLKSIEVYPVINYVRNGHEPEDLFTPSMTIIASKWSQSLNNLVIGSWSTNVRVRDHRRDAHRFAISKSLMLLIDLHEMQSFHLQSWRMENSDNGVRQLVMSWPKIRILRLPLNRTPISLSTLGIIAENCPELRHLQVQLDTSTIPLFDTSSKSLRHKLEVLTVGDSTATPSQTMLECQIQVTQHLDSIFPYLKSIEVSPSNVTWSGIRDLVRLCQGASLRRVK